MFGKKGKHYKENFHVKNQLKNLVSKKEEIKTAAKILKALDVFSIFSDLMKSNGAQTVKIKINMK